MLERRLEAKAKADYPNAYVASFLHTVANWNVSDNTVYAMNTQ